MVKHCKYGICRSYSRYLTKDIGINSLAPGWFEWNFASVNFKLILVLDDWGISCAILLIWMSLGFTDDKSTLVQVMAWCHQATSHYLNQCWPRSKPPYGVTRSQLSQGQRHCWESIYKCEQLLEHTSLPGSWTGIWHSGWLEYYSTTPWWVHEIINCFLHPTYDKRTAWTA